MTLTGGGGSGGGGGGGGGVREVSLKVRLSDVYEPTPSEIRSRNHSPNSKHGLKLEVISPKHPIERTLSEVTFSGRAVGTTTTTSNNSRENPIIRHNIPLRSA